MTGEHRRQNVQIEIELGREALEETRLLLDGGKCKGALSRLYYALFHHLRALLFTLGLEPKTHEGLGHLFGYHFIKPGIFPSSSAKLFYRLQKYREKADYEPTFVVTGLDVSEEMAEVEKFLADLEVYIEQSEETREKNE